jgi:hypothetical protein
MLSMFNSGSLVSLAASDLWGDGMARDQNLRILKLEFGPRRAWGAIPICLLVASLFSISTVAEAGNGIVLETGLNAPTSIAVDGNGRSLYFRQLEQSPCQGGLDAIPADGGADTQISSSSALYDSGYCRGVSSASFSGADIIFGYGGYVTYNIDVASAPCGSSCTHLVSGLSGGALLGALNGQVYYSAGFSAINSIPVSGGSSSQLTGDVFVRANVIDAPNPNYNAFSQGIYFIDYYTKNVDRLDLTSSTPTAVIQGLPDEGNILTDSLNTYWADGNSIIEAAKNSTCSVPTCTTLYSGQVNSFVVDEQEVDNSAGSIFFSTGSSLVRLAKSGGAQTMYSGTSVSVLQTDGAQVYFVDNGVLKSLPVNAISGNKPLTLASSIAVSRSTLNDGFYWTTVGSGQPGAGSVSYVVQQASQIDNFQYSSTSVAVSEHKCSCQAAVLAMLARSVLKAQGQYTAATGIKIDDFFQVTDPTNPCGGKGGGGDWGPTIGTWKNPVYNNVKLQKKSPITSTTNLSSLLQTGPVLLQDSLKPHWILATNQAAVSYNNSAVSGIVAYDPLSGSKVLLTAVQPGTYKVGLILDPKTNVWCGSSTDCPNLLKDINGAALKFSVMHFSSYDLTKVLETFTPDNYIQTIVRP